MNIFVHKSSDINTSDILTVRDLKISLTNNNYDVSSVKLILSNGKLVSPEVFQYNL